LEHLEHAIRYDKAAEHVRRAEHHGDESQRLEQRGVRRPSDQHCAQNHDSVNRVGSGHEGSVQHRGNAVDHLEADEDRHDEDVDAEYELRAHFADPTVDGCAGRPSRWRVGAWRISPPAVTQTALMMSSLKLRLSSPFGASKTTRAATFFA